MVGICVVFVLVVIEASLVSSRAYNCYTAVPCPLTKSASEPAWSYDVTAQCVPPINLFLATTTSTNTCQGGGSGKENKECKEGRMETKESKSNKSPSPSPGPDNREDDNPAPEPEPLSGRRRMRNGKDAVSTKLFTNLFAIPGALADTLLNGEIVI